MKCNTSRDMGNLISESLPPRSQPRRPEGEATPPENKRKAVDPVANPAHSSESQREASPSQGHRGKTAENPTVSKPRETQGLMQGERPLKELKPPNNYREILKNADSDIDDSSTEKLTEQLHAGVYLEKTTKKYWLDDSSSNCFMLYAKALSITWSDTPKYWKWFKADESGTQIDMVELKRVCWLEVHGRMDTKMLSPGKKYRVSFLVKLNDQSTGWKVPVKVRLALPGRNLEEQEENLMERPRNQWIEIQVGKEFELSAQDTGDMEISMYEYASGNWKHGLVIKGVLIEAKN